MCIAKRNPRWREQKVRLLLTLPEAKAVADLLSEVSAAGIAVETVEDAARAQTYIRAKLVVAERGRYEDDENFDEV